MGKYEAGRLEKKSSKKSASKSVSEKINNKESKTKVASYRTKKASSNNTQDKVVGPSIVVSGAKTHNLNNITVEFPKNKLVAVCGVSGSGKSSLAFDTIFAEGQRRYIESLSAYARQFLGQVDKPDVESITGLSPAVAIDQKSVNHNPRSTVGTVTEIWDHLRLLWARVGKSVCVNCNLELEKQSTTNIVGTIIKNFLGEESLILAPLVRDRKGSHAELITNLKNLGYNRIYVDGEIVKLESIKELSDAKKKHYLSVVVDRIKIIPENRDRLAMSVETATKLSTGFVTFKMGEIEERFATSLGCPGCGESRDPLEPRSFSFNSPYGACAACDGLGTLPMIDERLVVSNPKLSLKDGAITPWSDSSGSEHFQKLLAAVCKNYGGDMNTPYEELSQKVKEVILNGDLNLKINATFSTKYSSREYVASFEGVGPWLTRHRGDGSEGFNAKYDQYFRGVNCLMCQGSRLNKLANSVKIDGKSISEVSSLTISLLAEFMSSVKLSDRDMTIAERLLKEINERLHFLLSVGLNYLTLDRGASSLSGGESQRIRLATQIGSGLTGVLYVLDEPSIGLHQRDNDRLLLTLKKLRDLGNTVLVVEHDYDTIINSDWVIEIGPEAGSKGGNLVWSGKVNKLLKNNNSITGKYLSKTLDVNIPAERRKGNGSYLTLTKATGNNLKKVDLKIPLGTLTTVTGVSGSGKSTLINDTLAKALARELNGAKALASPYEGLTGADNLDKLVIIDQSPIGRTPRSNPATYVGLFDQVRTLFSMTEDSKIRGYQPGRFSFNVPSRNGGGRCEICQGDGTIKIAMNFLPDVYVNCESCKGKRYSEETLDVKYNGKNISEILEMPISQANIFFSMVPIIKRQLQLLVDVGLGYLQLGQASTTLSGGEAQRIKLASELSKRSTGKTIYILDEPTTGLHFDDIAKLLEVLQKLVTLGNTVLVIEHNLDVIKVSDHVIDLGPEGGPGGGVIIAQGSPEEVALADTPTAYYLAKALLK
jgi:excinuclease ABC subunit A